MNIAIKGRTGRAYYYTAKVLAKDARRACKHLGKFFTFDVEVNESAASIRLHVQYITKDGALGHTYIAI